MKSEMTVYFDVDDTLVLWDVPLAGVDDADVLWLEGYPLVIHRKHVEELKRYYTRDQTIVVWSAGGREWARKVVEALGLTDFVDHILSKPTWYYDDLPASEFMGDRIYHVNS